MCITRPDTPKSWSNYLGDTTYGAIITNNAGGYSFYKSGGMGRFMRLRFNSIPMDQPGRYIYFHDRDSGDYLVQCMAAGGKTPGFVRIHLQAWDSLYHHQFKI